MSSNKFFLSCKDGRYRLKKRVDGQLIIAAPTSFVMRWVEEQMDEYERDEPSGTSGALGREVTGLAAHEVLTRTDTTSRDGLYEHRED